MKFTIAVAALLGLATAVRFPIYNAWDSVKGGAEEGKYERLVTPHFATDNDDIFMRSMIQNYAQEERTKQTIEEDGTKTGGEPTGRFWMDKKFTREQPPKFSEPIRDYLVKCSHNTWIPTSKEHGSTSMLPVAVSLRLSRCHNS